MAKYTSYNFGNGCTKPARGLSWVLYRRHHDSASYTVRWFKRQKDADREIEYDRAIGMYILHWGYNPNVLWDDVIDTKVFLFSTFDEAIAHVNQPWKEAP